MFDELHAQKDRRLWDALQYATASRRQPLTVAIGMSIDQEPAKALEELARANVKSPWIANAIGVAQLRLGHHETAVEVLRRLVLGAGGIVL